MLKIIICNYIKYHFNKEITKKDSYWNNSHKYKIMIITEIKFIIKIKIGIYQEINLILIRKSKIMVKMKD